MGWAALSRSHSALLTFLVVRIVPRTVSSSGTAGRLSVYQPCSVHQPCLYQPCLYRVCVSSSGTAGRLSDLAAEHARERDGPVVPSSTIDLRRFGDGQLEVGGDADAVAAGVQRIEGALSRSKDRETASSQRFGHVRRRWKICARSTGACKPSPKPPLRDASSGRTTPTTSSLSNSPGCSPRPKPAWPPTSPTWRRCTLHLGCARRSSRRLYVTSRAMNRGGVLSPVSA